MVLTLSSGSGGDVRDPLSGRTVLRAHLRDEAIGLCAVRLDPTPRDYDLLFEGSTCGSVRYSAGSMVDGTDSSLSLTDNRGRLCRVFPAARLVVVERRYDDSVRTLYSYDGPRGGDSSR
jgi:hypothetical protein